VKVWGAVVSAAPPLVASSVSVSVTVAAPFMLGAGA
jgi:hypothetical protein